MEPLDQTRVFSDRYELTHLIARGGMAQVYRAHDQLLDREVALKVLFPELSVDQTFVERFRREAQAAAKLSHPNIVPVFDWGEDNGTYFIVMEYVDGQPLSAILRDQKVLPPTRAAVIAADVAAALSYAHRHGVIHRDVKPGNVLITLDGSVKVTDFGIARAVNTEESLTQQGSVMGTATYFSPEQAEGANVDARSDVYSLGIVLYEMLAGRPPFQGDSPVAVASKHVRENVPLVRDFDPEVPAPIEAITMKALAKQPAARYGSAEAMRADLLRYVDGKAVDAEDPLLAVAAAVNATSMMDAINKTQAVPVFPGPRRDLPRRKKKSRRNAWIIGSTALVAVIVIGFVVYAVTSKRSSGTINVPNVIGMSQIKATQSLIADGLKVGQISKVASNKPADQVVATNPGVGLPIAKGSSVDLSVSDGKGADQVAVPNVVNQPLQQAENALQLAGFTVKVVTSTSATSTAGSNNVVSQDPAAGQKVAKGSLITLTIPSSPQTVAVPNLVGQPTSVVGGLLGGAQLTIGSQATACSSQAVNNVASQTPSAGSQVAPNTPVNIVISTGPCSVNLPNVIGYEYGAAQGLVSGQGFSVATSTCSAGMTVTGQSPSGNQSYPPTQTVTLTCSGTTTTAN
jgi:eukaryotic-like serine/threonine-protein kinase